MPRKFLCALVLICMSSPLVSAQYSLNNLYFNQHRPAGLNWQVLKTEHFRIIYPQGLDSTAIRSGLILEHQYPLTKTLTGGSLSNFPVVLNSYNDISNGFVTPQNFRSEVDIGPFKGKSINPQSGSWLETVLPHELVHANHGNVIKAFSIPGFFSLFSPDVGRMFNFFPPVGIHEGLAVYHESNQALSKQGGRNNYTYFNNQFNANLVSNATWSMGQTVHVSDYTLPYNRHYIGGSTFTEWLHENYGEEVSKDAIGFHQYFFFLGYGTALKHATGKWPGQLYTEYLSDMKAREAERKEAIGSSYGAPGKILGSPFKGVQQRGPVWISDAEIVFYSTQYNAIRGYYITDIRTGKTRKLNESLRVGDFNHDFDPSTKDFFYASYFSGGKYTSVFEADIQKTNVVTGKTETLTKGGRVYAPALAPNGLIALQTDGDRASIVMVNSSGTIKVLKRFSDATPVSIATHPLDRSRLAVILNRRGVQGLWITTLEDLEEDLNGPPQLAFNDASIFDPDWHPTENRLLITVDRYPAMNIYEYNVEEESITQLTNSQYNAMEAVYSPDGNQVAYVQQVGLEQLITVMDFSEQTGISVPRSALLTGSTLSSRLSRPYLGANSVIDTSSWTTGNYGSDLSWLKPRAVSPVFKDRSGSTEAGLSIISSDVLNSQTYNIELTGIQNRLWYNATYTNTTFYPGFRISGYSEPSFFAYSNQDTGDNLGLMLQERGVEFIIPFSYQFRDLSRSSSFYFAPSFAIEQVRYFDLSPTPLSDFGSQYKAGGFTQLSLGLIQKPRDVQPASGISAFFSAEKALNDPEVLVRLPSGTRLNSTLVDRYGFFYGVIGFLSPFQKWNQTLRIDIQALQQSGNLLYSTDTIIPLGFKDDIFPSTPNLGRVSTRYTIPVIYPDDGGMLLPFYLRSVYLTAFTHTVTDLDSSDLLKSSRTIIGGGLHFQFNISNLGFDLGLGLAWEPARNQSQFIFGAF